MSNPNMPMLLYSALDLEDMRQPFALLIWVNQSFSLIKIKPWGVCA